MSKSIWEAGICIDAAPVLKFTDINQTFVLTCDVFYAAISFEIGQIDAPVSTAITEVNITDTPTSTSKCIISFFSLSRSQYICLSKYSNVKDVSIINKHKKLGQQDKTYNQNM